LALAIRERDRVQHVNQPRPPVLGRGVSVDLGYPQVGAFPFDIAAKIDVNEHIPKT
jgi:hypothetical protein